MLLASLAVTSAAYSYRIRVEDRVLVASLGPPCDEYRRQVPALIPARRAPPSQS
jgi:protein-S-isoprenylcysteine O-methyltransferase Ste14